MINCTEESFKKSTKDHKMHIIRDEGVHRHIRFKKPRTVCYSFDLITWPGHLCITGDCGTYVFQRTEDMFSFFRGNPRQKERLYINPGYWGEKLLSIGTNAGYKEFDEDVFKKRVADHFEQWKEHKDLTSSQSRSLWEALESTVLSYMMDGEVQAYQSISEFEYEGFQFEDFFDAGGTETYAFHYLWCLYAIVWGIQQYD